MSRIAIVRAGERTPSVIASWSRAALDRPLAHDAVLMLARPSAEANVLGAFQRATTSTRAPFVRRGSGGPAALVGPGSLWIALSLAHPSALVACEPSRIVNRYVRPLLRALTKCGATAHYFGRDWISVAHRPAALATFAHDAGTQRTMFEAIVAVTHSFADEARASFLGKEPGTLAKIAKRDFDLSTIESAIADAFGVDLDLDLDLDRDLDLDLDLDLDRDLDRDLDPPWLASVDEAIGEIGAGPDARGVFRVGGDLMVSRDALATLEARASHAPLAAIPALVDEILRAPGVAIDGVRDLASVAYTIERARQYATDPTN